MSKVTVLSFLALFIFRV